MTGTADLPLIIEEGPDHLEEAVLIALDYLAEDRGEETQTNDEPWVRLGREVAPYPELQCESLFPLHEMKLGTFRIDRLEGNGQL